VLVLSPTKFWETSHGLGKVEFPLYRKNRPI
jgi:hypothetical protein